MEFKCLRGNSHPYRDIICHCDSLFKIQVFDLLTELYTPNPFEVHFYGDNHGDELAFETIGYSNQSVDLVLAAIQWYADYLSYTGMRVYRKNPI